MIRTAAILVTLIAFAVADCYGVSSIEFWVWIVLGMAGIGTFGSTGEAGR
jgi:hypothetical protein